MSAGLNVAVLGNCQAQPLAGQLAATVPGLSVERVVIVHLARDEDRDAVYQDLDRVDLVIAQRVVDNYPCAFVRNAELKQAFGDKVLVWPNLYYRGYNPELTYLRGPDRSVVHGPLGDYHVGTIHEAWSEGLPVDEAVRRTGSIEVNRELYADVPGQSLEELGQREHDCDIQMAEWVAEHMWEQRLFHTFNHPASAALRELARRIVDTGHLAGVKAGTTPVTSAEPLGRWGLPMNPWVADALAPTIEDLEVYHGNDLVFGEGTVDLGRELVRYDLPGIAEAFYRVYDEVFAD
jgi:hypothetical protein